MKDDFVATVSHEVRTPLTSIRSFSEILRDNPDLDREQRQEFVGIIVKRERLSRLINDILDLAKMEAGTSSGTSRTLLPKAVIEQALAATAGLFAKARHISLETRIADNLPPIRADADRLTQVIVNLVSNAVKFCARDNGRVRLEAWEEAGFCASMSRTTAPALPRKIRRRSSSASSRLEISSPDKPQGTGLGLPISRQILQRFGGAIWVESEPGKGATFSIRVPVSPRSAGRYRSISGGGVALRAFGMRWQASAPQTGGSRHLFQTNSLV